MFKLNGSLGYRTFEKLVVANLLKKFSTFRGTARLIIQLKTAKAFSHDCDSRALVPINITVQLILIPSPTYMTLLPNSFLAFRILKQNYI